MTETEAIATLDTPVNQLFSSSVNVDERTRALKSMDRATLERVIKTDGVQASVVKAAQARLRRFDRSQTPAFGWEVDVRFQDGGMKTFHWRGCSRKAAWMKGMLKTRATEILEIRPVTEAEWVRAYGIGRM